MKQKQTTNFHLSKSKIYLPILIGLGVIVWLFVCEFDSKGLKGLRFSISSIGYIIIAFFLIFARDFGIIWRFLLMSDKSPSFKQAFNVHMLCEFTSAITPTAIGGSGFMILFLNKENISVAKSTTIMICNLFLDELFFIIICPLIFLFAPLSEIFNSSSAISSTISIMFWIIYIIIVIWATFLFIVLFFKPQWITKACRLFFKIPFLKKFQAKVDSFGEQLILASKEVKNRSIRFWFIAFLATFLSWFSRFLVVNALFMAFNQFGNQIVIFARQILIWIVMIVSPTPGGSGLSEIAFKEYYNDLAFSSTAILLITILWRIISYYIYLIIGALILPKWLHRVFEQKQKKQDINGSVIE